MNVTESKIKCRQLHKEGYLQKVSVEQRGYVKVHDLPKITENNLINSYLYEEGLLEKILSRDNMNRAFKKVKSNKGAAGIDGMEIIELKTHLESHGSALIEQILRGKYKPQAVRRVEIPKEEKGKVRKLGIPTVVDRVIQQAIAQKLTPIFEKQFSDNSFGFRPRRSAHDAMKRCKANINEGYKYVVDMDLEKYFDTVNHSKLIGVLSRTIKDGRVISLIHKYLTAGVIVKHTFKGTDIGTPQGGPLSPLLSNIMLNELDKELERRGHRFVRYADDLMIFCKSRKAASRTLTNIQPFIEEKLFLTINEEKTVVSHVRNVKFLGFTFYIFRKEVRLRIHPKAILKMRKRVKELTSRSNGWGNEKRRDKLRSYIIGWINYFKIADIKALLKKTDKWFRRRLRMIYWKQWKKIKTKFRYLKHLGIEESKAWEYANTRKGYWRISNSPILSRSLNNQKLKDIGYIFFLDYYKQVTVN
jgi:group II intron reverse transcriptase/maturase